MKIFYASTSSPNIGGLPKSDIWDYNLYFPLKDLGYEVIKFSFDFEENIKTVDTADPNQLTLINEFRKKISSRLIKEVTLEYKKKKIDLFFSYFYDAFVFPEVIDQIKKMGIVTVNWYCNGSYQLHLVQEISPHYDFCLVPEKFRLKDYKKMGANPIYCQEAANPNIYKPYKLKEEFDVVFIGQAYGERPAIIKFLLDNGINIRVYGPGWKYFAQSKAKELSLKELLIRKWRRFREGLDFLPDEIIGGVLSDEDMIKMYSRAKINLGFSAVGDTHLSSERIVQVRLRDFEIPMSKGFYMVEEMKELREFYRFGQEIVTYRNKEDLLKKIQYYLKHEKERNRIKIAGYKRARKDHSWHKRFQDSFKQMGLK